MPDTGPRADEDAEPPATLSELIGALYDCALNPDLWPVTLERICRALGGHSAGIVMLDYAGDNNRLVRDWGPTQEWGGDRFEHMMESIKHIHRQFLGISGPQAEVPILLPPDLTSAVSVFDTTFYREWAEPQGIHQVLEAVALSEPTRLGLFCVTRHATSGHFTSTETELLRSLAPHIRRAITIGDLLDEYRIERQAFSEVMDKVAAGVLIVGAGNVILRRNAAADAMLKARWPIREEGGALRGCNGRVTAELTRVIESVRLGGDGIGSGGIGVPLSTRDDDHSKLAVAYVLPLTTGSVRTRLEPQALAAVFINSDGIRHLPSLEAVARLFRLTPRQAETLAGLVDGLTLDEVAERLDIDKVTVKTHQSALFEKIGVTNRGQLVEFIRRLMPPIRNPDD